MSQSQSALAPAVFNFQSREVRTVIYDGEPWFVAADVCAALDLKNVTMALRRLDDDEQTTLSNVEGRPGNGPQSFNIISESGLYALIQRSRKPEAKVFRKWVTGEVLPAIRKTGGYGVADSERQKTAVAFALEASKLAAQTVIEAFLAGEEPRSSYRYLLSTAWNPATQKFDRAHVQTIDHKAYIASLPRLAKIIGDPGFMGDSGELAGLAQACVKELDSRLANYREARAIRAKQEAQ